MILSLPTSAPVSDLDAMERALREGGWAKKPAPMADLDEQEREMVARLMRRAHEPEEEPSVAFEWFWFENTLGRRWQMVQIVDGRRFAMARGFDQASLTAQIKRLRADGRRVRPAPEAKAAA